MKQRHFIDTQKATTLIAVLGMMAANDAWRFPWTVIAATKPAA